MLSAKIWSIYDELGSSACATGNFAIAQEMFSAAIETCDINKELNRERIKSVVGLADSCLMAGQIEKAERLYKKAINIFARTGVNKTSDRWILSHALDNLGCIYSRQNRLTEALKLLHRSVRITDQSAAQVNPNLARRLLQLSLVHSQLGNYSAAGELLKRARNIQSISKCTQPL